MPQKTVTEGRLHEIPTLAVTGDAFRWVTVAHDHVVYITWWEKQVHEAVQDTTREVRLAWHKMQQEFRVRIDSFIRSEPVEGKYCSDEFLVWATKADARHACGETIVALHEDSGWWSTSSWCQKRDQPLIVRILTLRSEAQEQRLMKAVTDGVFSRPTSLSCLFPKAKTRNFLR